jgi:hypothetical protein
MGGKRVPICSNSKHVWVRKSKRSKNEVCTTCGTKFPCGNKNCGHHDCAECREIGLDQWLKENT